MNSYKKTPIGERLKYWRELRGISQFDLALEGNTSAKHLSFVETGKAHPGRELILRLIDSLKIPLEVSNNLLIAAGYAPCYHSTGLEVSEMQQTTSVLVKMMVNNDPKPSALVDRQWHVYAYNQSFEKLCQIFMAQPELLQTKPLSFIKVMLHPKGLIYSIDNKVEFYRAIYSRVRRSMSIDNNQELAAKLMDEIISYCPDSADDLSLDVPQLMLPVSFKQDGKQLNFSLMTASLGSPVNIIFHEMQMEFFSATNQAAAEFLTSK